MLINCLCNDSTIQRFNGLTWRSGAKSIIGLLLMFATVACERKHDSAIVLEKWHIAASAISPVVTPPVTDSETKPTPIENESATLAPGQIAVDGVVMNTEARGTSQDPRALPDEQWLVKVKMLNDGPV